MATSPVHGRARHGHTSIAVPRRTPTTSARHSTRLATRSSPDTLASPPSAYRRRRGSFLPPRPRQYAHAPDRQRAPSVDGQQDHRFKKQGKSKGKFKKGGKKAATPPVKPKNGPKPDAECYRKEKGHWKRNYSKYLADLKSGLVKKKKEDLPDSRKAVENKWIFKRKTDADGNITVYKARLVAKGFRQIQGVDYDETFSPVAKLKSVRILLAIAAFFDYEIWQMDVKTAFLNGDIEEELYMRSIYGLKQASRSWNRRFDKVIKDFGFIQCHGEACIYKKSGYVFILNGAAVSWASSKQCTVAKSSTESEYIAASEASSEAMEPNEPINAKFYQLGNGGSLVFEHDLTAVSAFLGRLHPEFHGIQVNDQPGGELQWIITADLRGTMESPNSERILFSFLPELRHHAEHLDFMLYHTQQDLDNARAYANQTHLALATHVDAIKMLSKDRNKLRLQRAKGDATIDRLRAQIASLEATVKAQEDQLKEMEEDDEGIDLQGGDAFLSDDEDFEEDEFTEEEDYAFLEPGPDDIVPIDVEDEGICT
ncbi:hypothetical protein QYE76_039287 [Lolium multiflorum]|uniref:Reverse transcriptase Ty1/copia-type domain-containing protein n=1 Tax=Lolium multiflorum TaxID=4521 RepID=A0AAD8WS11_LOLMU|nr:hypothetical protein QYE76_039287 [Lolium multiflorum]